MGNTCAPDHTCGPPICALLLTSSCKPTIESWRRHCRADSSRRVASCIAAIAAGAIVVLVFRLLSVGRFLLRRKWTYPGVFSHRSLFSSSNLTPQNIQAPAHNSNHTSITIPSRKSASNFVTTTSRYEGSQGSSAVAPSCAADVVVFFAPSTRASATARSNSLFSK